MNKAIARRLLSERLEADEDFYQELVAVARKNIPRLEHGIAYKAQDVFGREYWKALDDNWLRRFAGQLLSHLVAEGKLPLRFANCEYCTIKRYTRI